MVKRFIVRQDKTALHSIIDVQSVAVNQEKKRLRSGMYASDFGSCMRKVYMQYFPEEFPAPQDIDARTARIFGNGDAVHTRLGGYLKREEAISFVDEVEVPRDELDVHGRCDGICVVEGRAVVVEFKSINKDIVDRPKEEHIGQLMWYLGMFKCLRQELKEDFGYGEFDPVDIGDFAGGVGASGRAFDDLTMVDKWLLSTDGEIRGELIYESKVNNSVFSFNVEFDEAQYVQVRGWFEQLKAFIDNHQSPPKRFNPSQFPCSWAGKGGSGGRCQYWGVCWGENKPQPE